MTGIRISQLEVSDYMRNADSMKTIKLSNVPEADFPLKFFEYPGYKQMEPKSGNLKTEERM